MSKVPHCPYVSTLSPSHRLWTAVDSVDRNSYQASFSMGDANIGVYLVYSYLSLRL